MSEICLVYKWGKKSISKIFVVINITFPFACPKLTHKLQVEFRVISSNHLTLRKIIKRVKDIFHFGIRCSQLQTKTLGSTFFKKWESYARFLRYLKMEERVSTKKLCSLVSILKWNFKCKKNLRSLKGVESKNRQWKPHRRTLPSRSATYQ